MLTKGSGMKFDYIISNPPYTTGLQLTSIYDKVIYASKPTGYQIWLIPQGWYHSEIGLHTKFRNFLFNSGLKEIIPLDWGSFEGITTSATVVVCEPGYTGPIKIREWSYDFRSVGYVLAPDTLTELENIIKNKPAKPLKIHRNKGLGDYPNGSEVKFLTKLSASKPAEFKMIDTPNVYVHQDKHRLAIPLFRSGEATATWRFRTIEYVEPNVFISSKYCYLVFESKEEALKYKVHLDTDEVANVIKWTWLVRIISSQSLKFIPLLEKDGNTKT
jgi:hypothetical protein